MSSFSKKRIDVIMRLSNNRTFNDKGNNTITLKGLRVEAQISNAGAIGASSASIKIYGMTQSDMNKLSVIAIGNNQNVYTAQNYIELYAGDDKKMSKVFEGNIFQAWADYSGLPEVPLVIQAKPLVVAQTTPAESMHWEGNADVADCMKMLASEMGLNFINVNVHRTMADMTLKGTYVDQMKALANAAGIYTCIELNTLTIAEWGTAIDHKIIAVSPNSGLIGVPSFSGKGVSINTLFNPDYKMQQTIQLNSLLDICDGKWVITAISHNLDSEKQGGAWFSNLSLQVFGNTPNTAKNTTTDNNDNTKSPSTTATDTSNANTQSTVPTANP